MALDVVAIADLLLVGRLRQYDDIREISDQVFAFLLGRHLRHVAADLILGQREVALVDIDAVDAGENRVGILRLCNGGCEEECRERECAECAAERADGSHEHDPLAKRCCAGLLWVCRTPAGGPGSGGHSPNPQCLAMAESGRRPAAPNKPRRVDKKSTPSYLSNRHWDL